MLNMKLKTINGSYQNFRTLTANTKSGSNSIRSKFVPQGRKANVPADNSLISRGNLHSMKTK